MADDVDIEYLVQNTSGYSGADIATVINKRLFIIS